MLDNPQKKEENNNKEPDGSLQVPNPIPRPVSQKKESPALAEDIFAGPESVNGVNSSDVPKPDIFNPKDNGYSGLDEKDLNYRDEQSHEDQAAKNKKIFILLFVFICTLLLVLVLVWSFRSFILKPSSVDPLSDINYIEDDQVKTDNNVNQDIVEDDLGSNLLDDEVIEEEPIDELIIQDSDNDGLSDDDEIQLGTDINKTDTDDDKLFDYEEVRVYKTDPLNPDSDGDGFIDGEEVLGGYDPLGSGKLYNIE